MCCKSSPQDAPAPRRATTWRPPEKEAVLDAGVLAVPQFQPGDLPGDHAAAGAGEERGDPRVLSFGPVHDLRNSLLDLGVYWAQPAAVSREQP